VVAVRRRRRLRVGCDPCQQWVWRVASSIVSLDMPSSYVSYSLHPGSSEDDAKRVAAWLEQVSRAARSPSPADTEELTDGNPNIR